MPRLEVVLMKVNRCGTVARIQLVADTRSLLSNRGHVSYFLRESRENRNGQGV